MGWQADWSVNNFTFDRKKIGEREGKVSIKTSIFKLHYEMDAFSLLGASEAH